MKRSPKDYVAFDPFADDKDGPVVRCRTVRIVRVRSTQYCAGNAPGEAHEIPAGGTARFEKAVVDGRWSGFYYCTSCIDRWLDYLEPAGLSEGRR